METRHQILVLDDDPDWPAKYVPAKKEDNATGWGIQDADWIAVWGHFVQKTARRLSEKVGLKRRLYRRGQSGTSIALIAKKWHGIRRRLAAGYECHRCLINAINWCKHGTFKLAFKR